MDGSAKAYGSGCGEKLGYEVPSMIIRVHLKTAGPQEGLHSCTQFASALLSAHRMGRCSRDPGPHPKASPQEGREPALVGHASCMLSVHPYSQSRHEGIKTMRQCLAQGLLIESILNIVIQRMVGHQQ